MSITSRGVFLPLLKRGSARFRGSKSAKFAHFSRFLPVSQVTLGGGSFLFLLTNCPDFLQVETEKIRQITSKSSSKNAVFYALFA